jgi:hypothetical protein
VKVHIHWRRLDFTLQVHRVTVALIVAVIVVLAGATRTSGAPSGPPPALGALPCVRAPASEPQAGASVVSVFAPILQGALREIGTRRQGGEIPGARPRPTPKNGGGELGC